MSVKQISVFIENKKGALAACTRFIADNGINIRALSIADTQDFGILRIICDDPKETESVLKKGGFISTVTDVLATEIADKPGSMATILEVLAEAQVVVEYTYAFLAPDGHAYMIFRVDDNAVASAALAGAGIKTANQEDLF
jgi:hypothetical protein